MFTKLSNQCDDISFFQKKIINLLHFHYLSPPPHKKNFTYIQKLNAIFVIYMMDGQKREEKSEIKSTADWQFVTCWLFAHTISSLKYWLFCLSLVALSVNDASSSFVVAFKSFVRSTKMLIISTFQLQLVWIKTFLMFICRRAGCWCYMAKKCKSRQWTRAIFFFIFVYDFHLCNCRRVLNTKIL